MEATGERAVGHTPDHDHDSLVHARESGDDSPRLAQRFADVVGGLNVLHGELVGLVAEAADRGEWAAGGGVRSFEQWVCWQTGCSPSTARQLVALVAARHTHPRLSALLTAGELTIEQAAAAVKTRPEFDEIMAVLAPMSTVAQIRTEVRVSNIVAPPSPPEDGDDQPADSDAGTAPDGDATNESVTAGSTRSADAEEFVAQGFDGDLWWLTANLSAERGAVVRAALEEAHDRLFRNGRHDVTWADALVDVASRSLIELPDSRHELYRINVFLPLDGPVHLTDGTALPDSVTRHLGCDATLSPVFTEDSLPTAVGRTQRIVPERTRRIVMHRDGGVCRNPLCSSRAGLEIHHIVHWLDGGPTDPDNLIVLCGGCHRLHHRNRLGINGDADDPHGVIFTDTNGRPLRRPRPNPPPETPAAPDKPYRPPLGEPLDLHALGDVFLPPITTN